MIRKAFSVLSLAVVAALCAGCGGDSPSVETVRGEIERRIPEARFEREFHLRLGRLSLGLARHIVHWADPGDPDTAILDDVHRIEVATYKVRSMPDLEHRLTTQTAFEEALTRNGWSMAVREREHGSRTWIFLRADDQGALRNLYVVALDSGELTLVRLDGRLDRAVADSIADHPKALVREMGGRG